MEPGDPAVHRIHRSAGSLKPRPLLRVGCARDLRLGYTTGKTTVFGKYIYRDGDNTDGDLTDWSRTNNTALMTVWSAPTENVNWYATYTKMKTDLGLPVCVVVFDG